MKTRLLCLMVLLACATQVWAQNVTVQLPEFQFFATSTTVLVPDRGSVLLGSVNRASSGRVEFGNPLGRNVATGADRSASNVRVSVYIHDFEAMDEALLGAASARQAAGRGVAGGARAVAQRASDRGDRAAPAASLAEIRRGRADQEQDQQVEAEQFYVKGQEAEVAGKKAVARQYYQMASRRATGRLQERALARINALSSNRGLATASR